MKKIIKIVILLILIACQGQKKNNTMETLHSKKYNSIELKLDYENSNSKNYWYLKAINSKNDTLLLDSFVLNDEPKAAIFHKYGDIRKQLLIGDYILEDNIFYIIIYKNGNVFLQENIINENQIDKNEYKIGEDKRGSYENFGDPSFDAKMIVLDNKVFISAQYCGLVYYNCFTKKINSINFFDTRSKKLGDFSFLKRETFNYNQKIIKSNDFTYNKTENRDKIEITLKKVINNNDIKFLGTLPEQRNEDIYCFFYKDYTSGIKIIRYDNDYNQWLIGDYKEEEIGQE
jgi:hypothetical protein